MRPADVPVVGFVVGSGPGDPVFETLLLAGPPVLVLLAVLGRSPVTVGVVAAYLGSLSAYVLYKGLASFGVRA